MAAVSVVTTSPADGDALVAIGKTIELELDQSADLSTAISSIVLYAGQDVFVAGLYSSTSLLKGDAQRDAFMNHPSLTGIAETDISLVYKDGSGNEVALSPTAPADESGYTAYLQIKPKLDLTADTQYTLRVIGNADNIGDGLSKRTVFDPVATVTGSGSVASYGGYTGTSDDTINIEITEAGNVGTAEFKWWLNSAPTTVYTEKVTHRKFRDYHEGVQFRFTGSGFVVGDTFTIGLYAPEYLATNFKVVFTTNDGSYTTAPTSPSTPGETTPPSSLYPSSSSSTTTTTSLSVSESDPADGHYRVLITENVWTIKFSAALDAATIDDDAVTIYSLPADGINQFNGNAVEIPKKLTVSGDTLTIEV